MKIRTDFVTNSSSSSMVVHLTVNDIRVTIAPEDAGEGSVAGLDGDGLLEQLKTAESAESLCSSLIQSVYMSYDLDRIPYAEMDESCTEKKLLDCFQNKVLTEYPNLDDIDTVILEMYFQALGEYAGQGLPDMLTGIAESYSDGSGEENAYEIVILDRKTGNVAVRASTSGEDTPILEKVYPEAKTNFFITFTSSQMALYLTVNDVSVTIALPDDVVALKSWRLLDYAQAAASVEVLCDTLIQAVSVNGTPYAELEEDHVDKIALDDFKKSILAAYPGLDSIETITIAMYYGYDSSERTMWEWDDGGLFEDMAMKTQPYMITGSAELYQLDGKYFAYEIVTLEKKTGKITVQASTKDEVTDITDKVYDARTTGA